MKKLINNLQILNKLGVSVVMNPPVQKVGASKNAKEAKFLLEKWAQNFPPSNKQSSNTIWDKNAEQLLIKFMEKSGNIKYNSLGNLRGRLKAINNKIEIIDNHKIKILNFPKSFYDYAITPYGNYIQIPFQDSCILNGTGFLAKIQSCSPSQRENLSLNLFDILYRACIKNPSQARIIGIMTLCLMTVNDPYMFYSYKTQNGKVILDDKGKEVVFFDEKKMDQHGKKLEASALFIQESILETILNEGQLDRFIMLPSKRRMLLAAYIVEAFPRVKEALYKINNPKAVGDFALTPKDKTKIERAKELLCQISHKQTVSESKDKSKSKIKKQVKKKIKRRKGRRKGYRARR